MAIPTIVSSSTTAGGEETLNVSGLSSIQTGDIVIVAVETGGAGLTIDQSYTQIISSPQNTGSNSVLYVYYKKYTSGDTNPTISNYVDHTVCVFFAIRGVSTSIFNTQTGATATSSTSVSFPSITTNKNDCLIINIGTTATDASTVGISSVTNASLSNPSTSLIDGRGTTIGNGGAVYFITGGLATAGNTGNTTGTLANSSVQGLVTLSIEPLSSGPANLKTYNTNLKANIKSINTNLIANVKSLNTNT